MLHMKFNTLNSVLLRSWKLQYKVAPRILQR